MTSAHLFQIQSVLIFSLMCVGILNRRQRSRHVPIMAITISWDIILILQIEFSRGAVLKATRALSNPLLLNLHVSIAVACVVLYGLLIFTGRKLLKGNTKQKKYHRGLGFSAFILRFLTLVSSFFVT